MGEGIGDGGEVITEYLFVNFRSKSTSWVVVVVDTARRYSSSKRQI